MEKLNNVVIEECKIMEDINHCLSLYVLKELHSEEEIKEALAEMLHLSQNFRHVHVELKALLGDKYNAKYPLYNDTYESLMKYVKEGKTKLRTVRSEAQNSSQSDEKNALEIELDFLLGRVAEERTYYDPGTHFRTRRRLRDISSTYLTEGCERGFNSGRASLHIMCCSRDMYMGHPIYMRHLLNMCQTT